MLSSLFIVPSEESIGRNLKREKKQIFDRRCAYSSIEYRHSDDEKEDDDRVSSYPLIREESRSRLRFCRVKMLRMLNESFKKDASVCAE